MALNPTRIRGTVGLTVGDTVTINGAVFMVVPASGTPYPFDGSELGTLIKPPLAIPKVSVDD